MKNLFRPLALATALGAGALAGTDYLLADEKPKPAAEPVCSHLLLSLTTSAPATSKTIGSS